MNTSGKQTALFQRVILGVVICTSAILIVGFADAGTPPITTTAAIASNLGAPRAARSSHKQGALPPDPRGFSLWGRPGELGPALPCSPPISVYRASACSEDRALLRSNPSAAQVTTWVRPGLRVRRHLRIGALNRSRRHAGATQTALTFVAGTTDLLGRPHGTMPAALSREPMIAIVGSAWRSDAPATAAVVPGAPATALPSASATTTTMNKESYAKKTTTTNKPTTSTKESTKTGEM